MLSAVHPLHATLLPALAPCPNFQGVCRSCKWCPKNGYIPRGFGGGYGTLDQIWLVIVTAEPGDPGSGESYSGTAEEMLNARLYLFKKFIQTDALARNGRKAPFHRNLRSILDLCWPGMSLDRQLASTWITNAVLCSARKSGGTVSRKIENACVSTYLKRQLQLLPNAYVLALGGKARERLKRGDVNVHGCAQHPSARQNTSPTQSWEKAAKDFREWLATRA